MGKRRSRLNRRRPKLDLLEPRRLFAGGFPDTTFSNSSANPSISFTADTGYAGPIVDTAAADTGGYYILDNLPGQVVDGFTTQFKGFEVVKYTAAGAIDSTFGVGGHFVFTTGSGAIADSMVRLPSGDLLIGGTATSLPDATSNTNTDFLLVQVTPYGLLNTSTLNNLGYATFDLRSTPGTASVDRLTSVTATADGHYVAYGTSRYSTDNKFALLKVAPDGSLDPTFDGDGLRLFASTDLGGVNPAGDNLNANPAGARAITTDTSSDVFLAGSSGASFAAVKFLSDGSLDSSFGSGGVSLQTMTGNYQSFTGAESIAFSTVAGVSVAGLVDDSASSSSNYITDLGIAFFDPAAGSPTQSPVVYADTKFHLSVSHIDDGQGNITLAGKFSTGGNVSIDLARIPGISPAPFNGGFVTVALGVQTGSEETVLAPTPDGGVLFASAAPTPAAGEDSGLLGLVNGAGVLETSFGSSLGESGIIYTSNHSFTPSSSTGDAAVLALNNGEYLAATISYNVVDGFALFTTRFTNTGDSLETISQSLGTGTVTLGGITRLSNGNILVAASFYNGASSTVTFFRFLPTGEADPTFGSAGSLTITPGTGDFIGLSAIAASPIDGSFYLLADLPFSLPYGLMHFSADGVYDSTFTTGLDSSFNGLINITATSVTVQPDGKIVVAGYQSNSGVISGALTRFGTDGSFDPSFHSGNILFTNFGANDVEFNAVAIDPHNNILVGGSSYTTGGNRQSLLARFTPVGAPDGSFGSSGEILLPHGIDSRINAIAPDRVGGFIYAGLASGVPYLGRLLPDGTVDFTYGSSVPLSNPDGGYSELYSVDVDNFGRPVAAGNGPSRTSIQAEVVQRFTPHTGLPTAALTGQFPVHFRDSSAEIQVTYYPIDSTHPLDPTSLGGNDLTITRPDNSTTAASLDTYSINPDGSITAAYFFTPTSGSFGLGDQGTYAVALNIYAVTDAGGLAVDAANLGSVNIAFTPIIVTTGSAPTPPVAGDTSFTFSIAYVAGTGRATDASTLDNFDVRLIAQSGGVDLVPSSFSIQSSAANVLIVQYTVSVPAGFVLGDTYTAVASAGAVADDLGVPSAANSNLFTFAVGAASSSVDLTTVTAGNGPFASLTQVPLSATIVNHTASPFSGVLQFYIPLTGGGEVVLGTLNTGTIDPNSTATPSGSFPLPPASILPDGTYTVAARLSPDGLNDFDFATGNTITIDNSAGQADLTLLSTSVTAGTYAPGDTLSPTAQVANIGTALSGTVFVRFLLTSASTGITYGLGSVAVNPIAAAGTRNISGDFTVPPNATIPAGRYTLTARLLQADGTTLIQEITGNVISVSGSTTGGGTGGGTGAPDLTNLTLSAGPYTSGQAIAPKATLTNSGTADTGTFLIRYLLKLPSGGSVTLGSQQIDPIPAGQSRTVSPPAGVALPDRATLAPGTYTVSAQLLSADGATVLKEVDGGSFTVSAPAARRVGGLDPTFGGGDGIVTSFIAGPAITTIGAALIPSTSGQIFSGGTRNGDLVLFRLDATGAVDSSFGTGGVLTVDFGGTETAAAFFRDAQGHFVLVGTSVLNGVTRIAIARFTPDGALDAAFGTAGQALITLPAGFAFVDLRAAAADSTGAIYLAGAVQPSGGSEAQPATEAALLRVTSGGALDSGFGTNGLYTLQSPAKKPLPAGNGDFTALLITSTRIYAGGSISDGSSGRAIVTALDPATGAIAKGFNPYVGPSTASTFDRVTALAAGPKNNVYVGGARATDTTSTPTLFRVASNGKADKGFNHGQTLLLSTGVTLGSVSSLLLGAGNTILVTTPTASSLSEADAGHIGTAAFRFTDKGAVDPFFNGGGPLTIFPVTLAVTAFTPGSSIDDLVSSKQGTATQVDSGPGGGAVRSVATQPVTGGTLVAVAQITPDAADLSAMFTALTPGTAAAGKKLSLQLSVANQGSLASTAPFSIMIVATPTTGSALTFTSSQKSKLFAGTSKKIKVSLPLAKDAPAGTYTVTATLVPTASDLDASNNDLSAPLPTFTITPGT